MRGVGSGVVYGNGNGNDDEAAVVGGGDAVKRC